MTDANFTELRLNLQFKNKIIHTGQKSHGTKVIMIYKYRNFFNYMLAPTSFYIFYICQIFHNLGEINGVSFHCDKEYGELFF